LRRIATCDPETGLGRFSVTGGVVEIGDGLVDIQSRGTANFSAMFASGGSGGLEIDGLGSAFTGRVLGFGGLGHSDTLQFIDFAAVQSASANFTYTSANTSNTSGTLTATRSGHSEKQCAGHVTALDDHVSGGAGDAINADYPAPRITSAG
jgi:hypothetical protein